MATSNDPIKQQRQNIQEVIDEIEKRIADTPEGEPTAALEMALKHKQAQMSQLEAGQAEQTDQGQSKQQPAKAPGRSKGATSLRR